MKKHHIHLMLLFLLCFAFAVPASAHRGRIDANGGHYDNETGEYHYHHGYPAHEHINGICPYNHDDQTKHQEGTSSYSTSTKKPELHLETPDPYPAAIITTEPKKTSQTSYSMAENEKSYKPYLYILLASTLLIFVLVKIIKKIRNSKKENEKLPENTLTKIKPMQITKPIIKYPEGYGIDNDNLPYKLNRVYGWGKEFNVFVTKGGHCYHRNSCKALKGKGKTHTLLHRYVALEKNYDCCRFCQPKNYVDDWYIEQFPNSIYTEFGKDNNSSSDTKK